MLTVSKRQMNAMADAQPNQQMVAPCDDQKTWIEVTLADTDGNPVPGERYQIRLPDSSLMTGVLDQNGKARFDSIIAGQATIQFPGFDAKEWKPL